jgi:hypothetical protein
VEPQNLGIRGISWTPDLGKDLCGSDDFATMLSEKSEQWVLCAGEVAIAELEVG